MPDKAKTGPLFRKLAGVAPYPQGDATPAAVVRWLAAQGLLSDCRTRSGNDQFPPSLDHAHLIGAQFAAAFFLEGMRQLAGMMTDEQAGRTIAQAADIMAGEVVTAWNGGDFGSSLWSLLGDGGNEVALIAEELASAMAEPDPPPLAEAPHE